ncbi:MAG TPA: DedA family protein [Symbiobacteriaceae bacterium]|nr:DedA family protein [Symbiobacteriaceae bacterium]
MDWAIGLMEAFGYSGIVLIVLLENLFPPIPSEVVLPFGGFMTTTGTVTIAGVVAASTLGSLLGAIALYWIGAWFGQERIYQFVDRYQRYLSVTPKQLQQAERWFAETGTQTVFFCRMVPIMRSIISLPAGLVRMNLLTFSVYTLLGSLIWNTGLVVVGALLRASWPLVSEWVGYYQNLVVAVCILAVAVLIVQRLRKNRAGQS